MIKRKITKQLDIGGVKLGGDAPIVVQSMCNTDTRDVDSTLKQISEMAEHGCEVVRLAVLNKDAAAAIKEIVKKSPIPIISDIHFDYRLAISCIENGVHALRINPGNIGKQEKIEKVVKLAKANNTPIRIGINSGSVEKEYLNENCSLSEKMLKSAQKNIKILEDLNFDLIAISMKGSDVLNTIEANQLLSNTCDYPLHLGVTEAGTLKNGLVKSSVALGVLLYQGIGDTIRISLTENPVEEVDAAYSILNALNIRRRGVNFVSCPTCGRTQIDLIGLAKKVESKFKTLDLPITSATMGCAVNGPGEARNADFGIAGGINEGYIFKKGEIVARVPESELLDKLEEVIANSYK